MKSNLLKLIDNPKKFIERSYEKNVDKIAKNKKNLQSEFKQLSKFLLGLEAKRREIVIKKYQSLYQQIKKEFDIEERMKDFEMFPINKDECNKYYQHALAQTDHMKKLIQDIKRDLVMDNSLPSETFNVEHFKNKIMHKFALEKR
jgi:hypothetical protein